MCIRRLLHPLKIQPGILLGTDLNNVVGDERWPGEHALQPSFLPRPSNATISPSSASAEIQNLKAARRRRDDRRRGGQERAKRGRDSGISRFPPWALRLLKDSTTSTCRKIFLVPSTSRYLDDSQFNSKTRQVTDAFMRIHI